MTVALVAVVDVDKTARSIESRIQNLTDVKVAAIRGVRREFSRTIAKWTAPDVVALGVLLVEGGLVPRFVAYELILHHRAALASLRAKDVQRLGRGLASWVDVDTFACYIAGPVWRERQIADALVLRWAKSRDRWLRRLALASTVALNNKTRGGSGDARRTLAVCQLLIDDRDDMVVKAMSWALRELAKREPNAVKAFVKKHGNGLAARVRREVANKLTTGLKTRVGAFTCNARSRRSAYNRL